MKILALEFSSEQRSVAVIDEGRVCGSAQETGTQLSRPLNLVDAALREARLEREQIECLAIGLGPGSYTGIRMAISLAQGWQLARPVQLLGISSAECLAAQAQIEGISGKVNIVIDAQRNEFYWAAYEINKAARKLIQPLRLATAAEIKELIGADEMIVGPEVGRWFPDGRILFPQAATLGQLAAERTDFVAGELLAPIYLREPNFVKAPSPRVIPNR